MGIKAQSVDLCYHRKTGRIGVKRRINPQPFCTALLMAEVLGTQKQVMSQKAINIATFPQRSYKTFLFNLLRFLVNNFSKHSNHNILCSILKLLLTSATFLLLLHGKINSSYIDPL